MLDFLCVLCGSNAFKFPGQIQNEKRFSSQRASWGSFVELGQAQELLSTQGLDERTDAFFGGLDGISELGTKRRCDLSRGAPAIELTPAEAPDVVETKTPRRQ